MSIVHTSAYAPDELTPQALKPWTATKIKATPPGPTGQAGQMFFINHKASMGHLTVELGGAEGDPRFFASNVTYTTVDELNKDKVRVGTATMVNLTVSVEDEAAVEAITKLENHVGQLGEDNSKSWFDGKEYTRRDLDVQQIVYMGGLSAKAKVQSDTTKSIPIYEVVGPGQIVELTTLDEIKAVLKDGAAIRVMQVSVIGGTLNGRTIYPMTRFSVLMVDTTKKVKTFRSSMTVVKREEPKEDHAPEAMAVETPAAAPAAAAAPIADQAEATVETAPATAETPAIEVHEAPPADTPASDEADAKVAPPRKKARVAPSV